MKKFLSMLAFAALVTSFWACDDGDDDDNVITPDAPTIAKQGIQSVKVGETITLQFSVEVPGGYKTATATADKGTATVTQLTAGAEEGTVSVAYTAPNEAGQASVELEVEDNNGKKSSEDVAIVISASAVPSISGIPATATITAGQTLMVEDVVLTSEDGFASSEALTLTINDEENMDLSALITGASPQTVDISFPTTIDMVGTHTLVFTLTDANGDMTSVTHVLSVVAPEYETVVVQANIEENTTWTNDKIYELGARVIVEPGVTLTIEAGTIIKGQVGDGPNATALIIARGAMIMAEGTAEAPIIFTSTSDNILPGQIASPNLDEENSGLWGGLIILGDAPISVANNSGEALIEGVPADEGFAVYGGDNAADNSGIIRYVSVRHGGTALGDGDEINGITLGGVGSATVVENIEVVANLDDGLEIFGGTVNVSNVMIWAPDDDGLDIDQAFAGTVDNVIVIAFAGTDHNMEIDGPEGSATGSFTITNASMKGLDQEIADFREMATGSVDGLYIFGFDKITDGEGDLSLSSGTVAGANGVAFSNVQITLPTGGAIDALFPASVASSVTAVAAGAQTVGADETQFTWTFAHAAGVVIGF